MLHRSNPFSTRFICPGAMAFHFAEGETVGGLVSKLEAQRWLGEIIGPHGTGKSTLLKTLMPALEATGRRLVHFKLTTVHRSLSAAEVFGGHWDAQTLVVIDGYEQLNVAVRYLLAARREATNGGMLVTAHEPMGFPLLYQTRASEQILQSLVEQLTRESEVKIHAVDAAQALQASRGNIREALFRLYDLYESRKGSVS